jgi:hypothetical protein
LPGSHQIPTTSHSSSRTPTHCLGLDALSVVTHAIAPWRQAQVCLRPLPSYGEDRASRPPPLQHRVPIRAALVLDFSSASAQRRPYPDCSGAFSVTGQATFENRAQAPGLTRVVLFQPRGLQDVRMSLSTLFICSRRSAAASLWSVRNPCIIQADTEPPGRLPPAPGSHVRRTYPSPGGLSLAQVGWGFPRLSSIPAASLSFLTESQAMM